MDDSIWQSIANISWVMYPICYFLIYRGYLASKQRVMPLSTLLAGAGIFILISCLIIITLVPLNPTNMTGWTIMLILGMGIGWLYFNSLQVKGIEGEKKFLIPGSWTVMFMILMIMASKYYFGYQINLNPEMLKSAKYSFAMMTLYGLITGLFLGRIAYAMRVVKLGPFVPAT